MSAIQYPQLADVYKNKNGDIKFISHEEIVCPHCGDEFMDSWEYSEGVIDCESCGGRFDVERDVQATYNTFPLPKD